MHDRHICGYRRSGWLNFGLESHANRDGDKDKQSSHDHSTATAAGGRLHLPMVTYYINDFVKMIAGYGYRVVGVATAILSWFSFCMAQYDSLVYAVAGAAAAVALAAAMNVATADVWCKKCSHVKPLQSSVALHALLRVELIAAAMYTLLKYGSDKTLPTDTITTLVIAALIGIVTTVYAQTHEIQKCSHCNAVHSIAGGGYLSAAA